MKLVPQGVNRSHGGLLAATVALFGLNDGDRLYVVLIPESKEKPKNEKPKVVLPLSQPNAKSNNNQKPQQEPKVVSINTNKVVETGKKVAVAAVVGYLLWKAFALSLTVVTDGLAAPLLSL
jgi:hypothetical protein